MADLSDLFVSDDIADAYRRGRQVGERVGETRASETPSTLPYPDALTRQLFDMADAAYPAMGDEAYAIAKAADAWIVAAVKAWREVQQ